MILFVILILISFVLMIIGLLYYRIGFIGTAMFFLSLLIIPIQMNTKYIKSKTEIPFTAIKQEIDGRYFVVDKEYNKSYPDIKIVQTDTKYIEIKEGYKFLDWATPDDISHTLYLNLKDVSK